MMNDEPPFELTAGEKLSPLWLRLKAHLEEQLRMQRARNDHNSNEQETALTRGDIRRLKATIALGDDRPLTED
jgi:hypothetical protein